MKRLTQLSLCFPLALLACTAPDKRSESPFAPAPDPKAGPPKDLVIPKPWTDRFLATGALVANDVRIEGPDGLLEHVVSTQDLQFHEVVIKATPDGLLQTITLRADAAGQDIRAQLDNLAISCWRSLTILERPGPVDVTVSAVGDVLFVEKGSDAGEQRGSNLRIVGQVQR
ncbi:MAG: hypothetical protein JNL28_04955 [Planctomycetes bacterium]|nr:hypothetical protein [Planctomycetota bacterium]